MSSIKKGDVVQLKSGGPVMTVSNVGNYAEMGGFENGAACTWFDKNGKKSEDVFDVEMLRVLPQS